MAYDMMVCCHAGLVLTMQVYLLSQIHITEVQLYFHFNIAALSFVQLQFLGFSTSNQLVFVFAH